MCSFPFDRFLCSVCDVTISEDNLNQHLNGTEHTKNSATPQQQPAIIPQIRTALGIKKKMPEKIKRDLMALHGGQKFPFLAH